jgi:hypothetical protein
MTALKEYQKLECTGLWRDAPDAQRREVMVVFGDATLVVSDSRSDRALAHWSLPAVERRNPGEMPALYSPSPDAGETLELDDITMIDALERVHSLIEARRPHPGRLRFAIVGTTLAAMLALGSFWLPRALVDHTLSVVPASKRLQIGQAVLADVTRVTGAPCTTTEGLAALRRLKARLLGPTLAELEVVPDGVATVQALPGRIILIGRDLVEKPDSADLVSGYILAEQLRAEMRDPLGALLRWAGLRASFDLLTTGELPDGALQGYAETLLTAPKGAVPDTELLIRFAGAGASARTYALAIDPAGASTKNLIDDDPYGDVPPPEPLLSDDDWVALQGICGN